jgi:glucose-6-phosphate isomerase
MDLANAADMRGKIDAMFNGEHINSTEDRAVLHVATRARRDQVRRSARPKARAPAASACNTALASRSAALRTAPAPAASSAWSH